MTPTDPTPLTAEELAEVRAVTVVRFHHHAFPNGNTHRHAHALQDGHPSDVNKAHPQPYYFLCADCEPERAKIAQARNEKRIAEEFRSDEGGTDERPKDVPPWLGDRVRNRLLRQCDRDLRGRCGDGSTSMTPTDPTPLSAEELEELRDELAEYADPSDANGPVVPRLLATLDARELDGERREIVAQVLRENLPDDVYMTDEYDIADRILAALLETSHD